MFEVSYSEILEQPLKVNYLVKCTNGKFSRSGLDFVKDKHLPLLLEHNKCAKVSSAWNVVALNQMELLNICTIMQITYMDAL